MSQYGIGVTRNRFELFDSDEDPIEVLQQHEKNKEERKKTKVSGKENTTNSKEGSKQVAAKKVIKVINPPKVTDVKKPKEPSKKSNRPLQGNSNDFNNGKARPGNVIQNVVGDNIMEFNETKMDKTVLRDGNGRSVRGGNRGRGGRGSSRINTSDSRNKRDFDRQSGSEKTSVKPVDKKEGSGNHNWGNVKDSCKEVGGNSNSERFEKITDSGNEVGEQGNDSEDQSAVNNGEGVREMTLDEWKAQQMPRAKTVHNLRKAGEGEDLSRWKKMYALEKKNIDEEDDDDEYEHCEYPQRAGRQKHLLDIDIHFKDVRAPRGRGRGQGLRGSGRNIGPTGSQKLSPHINVQKEVPKVDNEFEFPSLG